MFTNYLTTSNDLGDDLVNVGTNADSLITCGQKTTSGAPDTDASKYIKGCIIANTNSGIIYVNTGSTASPVWSPLDSTATDPLTDGNIFVGNAANVATDVAMSGDVSIDNTGATTVGRVDLETATILNIATTEILIGTGPDNAAFAALSGDATMDNTGVVTVVGSTGDFTVGGNLIVTAGFITDGGAMVVLFSQAALPQALTGAGAITLNQYQTQFTSIGAGDALTMADGTQAGQIKKVSYVAEGGAGDTGVITPTSPFGYATVTLNAVGDYVVFAWTGTFWLVNEYVGATLA